MPTCHRAGTPRRPRPPRSCRRGTTRSSTCTVGSGPTTTAGPSNSSAISPTTTRRRCPSRGRRRRAGRLHRQAAEGDRRRLDRGRPYRGQTQAQSEQVGRRHRRCHRRTRTTRSSTGRSRRRRDAPSRPTPSERRSAADANRRSSRHGTGIEAIGYVTDGRADRRDDGWGRAARDDRARRSASAPRR